MKLNISNEKNIGDNVSILWGNNTDAYNWYFTAKENIITAKILFENSRYAHAIFFMQQCIECLIKGIFLETGIIVEPKDINHKPEKAFITLYEKIGDTINKNNCNFINKKLDERKPLSFENKLLFFIGVINNINSQYEKWLYSSYSDSAKYNYIQNTLFCLSKLFEDTQQNTRYPMNDNNGITLTLPSKLYNNPIIKNKIKSLISLIENIIDIITYGIDLKKENDYGRKI